ncbi:MAG: CoA transferase [Ectothiorhodospiraceae bacterium]|nr:CoA transferase [Chromatiales bacterium]MCP5156446.1 CoA transferase [Ectothiorhodospiraceae bacterium]
MFKLLQGLRVVEASAFVAAPLAGLTLSQLGAEVIRVDTVGGGPDFHRWPVDSAGRSLYWAGLNKGKRSVALDLRSAEGRELLLALATAPGASAGLVVTNFPVRSFLSYESLRARRADVVVARVQGDADGGNAVDYTVNCALGYPAITGPEGHDGPVNHVLPAWDLITGVQAALGLVVAHRHREATGEGQEVRVALSDVGFAVAGHLGQIAETELGGVDRPRVGNHIFGTFGRDFATADGRRLMIVAITDRQWQGLVQATGLAEPIAAIERALGLDFRREGDRYQARKTIAGLVESWCEARPYAEVAAALETAGACFGPYRTLREALTSDPRLSEANPIFSRVTHPDIGTHLTPGSPMHFSGAERITPEPAPRLGQDTRAVLEEVLGLGAAEVDALHARGVAATPR